MSGDGGSRMQEVILAMGKPRDRYLKMLPPCLFPIRGQAAFLPPLTHRQEVSLKMTACQWSHHSLIVKEDVRRNLLFLIKAISTLTITLQANKLKKS